MTFTRISLRWGIQRTSRSPRDSTTTLLCAPHETAEAWLFGGPTGARVDLKMDVGAVLDAKIAARLEHRSQTGDPAALRRRWRRVGREERFAQVDLR